MSRELVVQLIKKKKAIHKEQYHLEIEELSVEEELAFCTLEEEPVLQLKLLDVQSKKSASKAQINRAYLFSPRYTQSFIPSLCICCFVDKNKESLMIEVESHRGNGIKQYECPACQHVLRVNPI